MEALWRILLKHIQLERLTYWQCIACISGHCCYSSFQQFSNCPIFWVNKMMSTPSADPNHLTVEKNMFQTSNMWLYSMLHLDDCCCCWRGTWFGEAHFINTQDDSHAVSTVLKTADRHMLWLGTTFFILSSMRPLYSSIYPTYAGAWSKAANLVLAAN